jgi:hypothetical protein
MGAEIAFSGTYMCERRRHASASECSLSEEMMTVEE